ncbi:transmembrane and coiled-coil domain protein 3-like isoform X2 [Stigmatopora nigra]
MRRGGSDSNLDAVDGVGLDFNKGALGIDGLQQKILKVTEQIKVEQAARDQNVAEYLKLVNNADKQQVLRIRHVFEKKNQKSAHSVAKLQRKLERYHRRARESQPNGKPAGHREGAAQAGAHPEEGAPARHPAPDKVKTAGPGVSLSTPFFFNKSRGLANLIRNKYGSADNIAQLKGMDAGSGLRGQAGGRGLSGRGLSGSATAVAKAAKYHSDDECSTGTSASVDSDGNPAAAGGRLPEVPETLRRVREAQTRLGDDIRALEVHFRRDYGYFTQVLQEERYRYERLEEQLNDLTELHQHETGNLKQELASVEEKVAYQAYERARDIQEVLESCQTRVAKLELQQQQQQTAQLENGDAKVLLGKCINIMLAFATVILVCVSTAAKFAAPLLRSRLRLALTCVGVSLLALLCKNWEHLQCALERRLLPH